MLLHPTPRSHGFAVTHCQLSAMSSAPSQTAVVLLPPNACQCQVHMFGKGTELCLVKFTHTKSWSGVMGWKANLSISNTEKRRFGNWKETRVKAVANLLGNYTWAQITDTDRDSITNWAQATEAWDVVAGSQPSQVTLQQTATSVKIVHQIYGLFRDDKPMPEMFQDSSRRWKDVASAMGAMYHLWTADELETLVYRHYPQFGPCFKTRATL